MPINFIHNQIEQTSANVREKLPLPVQLLAGAAIMTLIVASGLGVYRWYQANSLPSSEQAITSPVYFLPKEVQEAYEKDPSCALETSVCPDGETIVGRTGPNCSFAACPGELAPPSPSESLQNFANPDTGLMPPPMTDQELLEYIQKSLKEDEAALQE